MIIATMVFNCDDFTGSLVVIKSEKEDEVFYEWTATTNYHSSIYQEKGTAQQKEEAIACGVSYMMGIFNTDYTKKLSVSYDSPYQYWGPARVD